MGRNTYISFMRRHAMVTLRPPGAMPMSDILCLLLGTGGILLMAAYAALCERI